MTTLASAVTTLVVAHRDLRCALGLRAGGCAAARDAIGFLGASSGASSRHYHPLLGAIQVQRESPGHYSRSKSSQKTSWKCFAELEKAESESTKTAESSSSSPPNCCTDEAEGGGPTVTNGESGPVFETYGPDRRANQLFALASVTVAVGLFLSGRLGGGPGLSQLAAASISYEEALRNGRPTVVEFYADWCEVCKETAHDVYQVEQEYKGRINFVMLNVDNSKWDEELDEFGVEGIPHFAFLDNRGNEEGNIVGRLPSKILKENLAALARGDATVPHSRVVGQFSSADSKQAPAVVTPRGHSQMS